MSKNYTNTSLNLVDLLTGQLEDSGHRVKTYNMTDGSGRGIEIRKRKDKAEYMIELEFDESGHVMTGVALYQGEVIESVDHRRLV